MPKIMHACDICGELYEKEAYALRCEVKHTPIERVVAFHYQKQAKFPDTIIVTFKDKTRYTYRREKQLECET